MIVGCDVRRDARQLDPGTRGGLSLGRGERGCGYTPVRYVIHPWIAIVTQGQVDVLKGLQPKTLTHLLRRLSSA